MPMRGRLGFSLIELLVVIAILVTLLAILLPAVQRVRSAAHQVTNSSNLKQIGIAFHNYHFHLDQFPAAISDNNVSCFTRILPYVEQDDIARRYNPTLPPNVSPNQELASGPLKLFLNPAMPMPVLPPHPSVSSYGACVGSQFAWAHAYPPGSFPRHDGAIIPASDGVVRLSGIRDGTSNTFLVGEMWYNVSDYLYTLGPNAGQVRGGNTSWVWGYPSYSFGSTIVPLNHNRHTGPIAQSGIQAFRTDNPHGCHFLMCDGSVRFIRTSIDLESYRALSTRAKDDAITYSK